MAYRHQFFLKEKVHAHACPCGMLKMNYGVKATPGENERVGSGRNIQCYVRVHRSKAAQAGNKPPTGKRRQDGNIQTFTAFRHSHYVLGMPFEPFERFVYVMSVACPNRIKLYAASGTVKQSAVQQRFKARNLPADGSFRQR